MADSRISNLTAALTPLDGTEEVVVVQSGVTKKATVADTSSLTNVLNIGNTTSGNNITLSSGDVLYLNNTSNGLSETGGEVYLYSGGTIGLYSGASSKATLDGLGALRTNSLGTNEYIELNPKGESIYYNNGTYYTQLQYTAPTANNIITIPDSSGTLALTSDSLGGSNQTITDATRLITLSGATASESLDIQNSSATSLIEFYGDETVRTNSEWGFGTAPSTTHKVNVLSTGATNGIKISGVASNGLNVGGTNSLNTITATNDSNGANVGSFIHSGTSGANRAIVSKSKGIGGTTNTGIRLEASGATANYSIDIQAGDYKISHSSFHNMILGGALSTDGFAIRNSTDTSDLFVVDGTGSIGVGASTVSTNKVKVVSSVTGGVGVLGQVTAGTGTNTALQGVATTTNTGTNRALVLNAQNGANNYSMQIISGDIKTPSGTGQTGTYTFGGGSSGDIATMQYENGILIATTTVP